MRQIAARLLLVGLCVAALAGLTTPAVAETVLGCPYGLEHGDLWLRTFYQYVDHTERWVPQTRQMEDLPDGWSSTKQTARFRLGYGLIDRLDIGVSFDYGDREARLGTSGGGFREINNSALEDIWVAAKYKFVEKLDRPGPWEETHIAFGVGVKLPQSSDVEVTEGLGNGADAVRLGLLWHLCGEKNPDICGHLTYTFVDDAPTITGYKKSGWELSDRFAYKLFLEHDLSSKFALVTGPTGWIDLDEPKGASGGSGFHAYSHKWALNLCYHPNGVDIEHQRLTLGISVPYNVRASMAPDYALSAGAMWTW